MEDDTVLGIHIHAVEDPAPRTHTIRKGFSRGGLGAADLADLTDSLCAAEPKEVVLGLILWVERTSAALVEISITVGHDPTGPGLAAEMPPLVKGALSPMVAFEPLPPTGGKAHPSLIFMLSVRELPLAPGFDVGWIGQLSVPKTAAVAVLDVPPTGGKPHPSLSFMLGVRELPRVPGFVVG